MKWIDLGDPTLWFVEISDKGWYTNNVHFKVGCWVSECLSFVLKKIKFAPWSSIMLSQTLMYYWQEIFLLTLTSQWSIPLHCLWAKSNNRTRDQFEYDVTWFCFCFDFVRSHVRCGFCSIVRLPFQVLQIKQVDCKLSTLLYLNVGRGQI